jgi:hypothetical protein
MRKATAYHPGARVERESPVRLATRPAGTTRDTAGTFIGVLFGLIDQANILIVAVTILKYPTQPTRARYLRDPERKYGR